MASPLDLYWDVEIDLQSTEATITVRDRMRRRIVVVHGLCGSNAEIEKLMTRAVQELEALP